MAERLAAARFAVDGDASAAYASDDEHSSIGLRILAYAVDSAVLFGFTMLFATIAFLVVFIGSDTGRSNITDGQAWGLVSVLLATFPAWLICGVLFVSWKGYTVGQYVIGLRSVDEQGNKPTLRHTLGHWLALHPLLFHPILAGPWLLFAYVGLALAESEILLIAGMALALICFFGPFAGLAFALSDPRRRGIHDRLAGMKVIRL
jgi:uncharacterized RDD family membrane protein YckC